MERAAYWAGHAHLTRDQQWREWEASMDRWLAGWGSDQQTFLKRLLAQNGQPVDSVTVSANALYRVFMGEGASDIEFYARRVLERNSPEQVRHQWELIAQLANMGIREPLIGSRALAAYDDVDGSSTANNRPWSRQCTARLFEGLTPVHVPILSE
jgi:hypothetical protein